MGFLGFSFGKKRRRSTKRSKVSKKPPSRLLRICKKYCVKATVKRGGKRVYKSVKLLKKLCLKKAYALKKKLMKMAKMAKKAKKCRKSGFGAKSKKCPKGKAGKKCRAKKAKSSKFGDDDEDEMEFGKRRRGAKTSRKAAMMAFNKFFKRHCAGRRGSRFGSGNPPLSASMGYEFCPSGMGGVLGANSTGLFPSPCISPNQAQIDAEQSIDLPDYSSSMPMFGARRRTMAGRRRRSGFGYRRKAAAYKRRKKPVGRRKMGISGRTKVGGRRNAGGCSAKRNTYGFGTKPVATYKTQKAATPTLDDQFMANLRENLAKGEALSGFQTDCIKKGFNPMMQCIAGNLKFGRRR
jgi:hypothetical protein